jgi:hypothetical protein
VYQCGGNRAKKSTPQTPAGHTFKPFLDLFTRQLFHAGTKHSDAVQEQRQPTQDFQQANHDPSRDD